MRFKVELTDYGRKAIEDGCVQVAQTGDRYGSVPEQACRMLLEGDWSGFAALYRRCRKLRMSMESHTFDADNLTEIHVVVSYGSASLAYIRLPEDRDKWIGMSVDEVMARAWLAVYPMTR